MIEDFFDLLQVSTTPVVHLELQMSLRIFKKIQNGPNDNDNDKGKWLYQTMPAALSSSNVPWFPIGSFWEFAKRIYYNDKSDKYCTKPPCIQD
jgi:hypothetical protein